MKRKNNEGFTLIETMVAIVVLGIVVVPVCSSLVLSFRMNGKADQLMRDQLAVSSVVETLMAEGVSEQYISTDAAVPAEDNYGWAKLEDNTIADRFPEAEIKAIRAKDDANNLLPYYDVTVSVGDVEVTTTIRAVESAPGGGTG